MILCLRSCGVLFTRQARIQKRGVAGPGDKSMMEQGMVFVTVTRRLTGSHGLGICSGSYLVPKVIRDVCAQIRRGT
jgi:hypothetical protein